MLPLIVLRRFDCVLAPTKDKVLAEYAKRKGGKLNDDQFIEEPYDKFDYLLANPPFGVDWKKQQKEVETEHGKLGFAGRFGAGLPRVNDGALLFLQHMIAKFEADPDLRDFENIPLTEDVDAFFKREVLPHIPDAWMDRTKDKIGYEINFNRHFYTYTPPRPLPEIDAELKCAEDEIMRLLREVTARATNRQN